MVQIATNTNSATRTMMLPRPVAAAPPEVMPGPDLNDGRAPGSVSGTGVAEIGSSGGLLLTEPADVDDHEWDRHDDQEDDDHRGAAELLEVEHLADEAVGDRRRCRSCRQS